MISSQSQVVLLGSPPLASLSSFPDLDNRRKAENTHAHRLFMFPACICWGSPMWG